MRQLFDSCQSYKSKDWVQFPHGMHNDTCMQNGYFTAIGNFLKGRILPQKSMIQTKEEIRTTHPIKKKKKYRFQERRKSTYW